MPIFPLPHFRRTQKNHFRLAQRLSLALQRENAVMVLLGSGTSKVFNESHGLGFGFWKVSRSDLTQPDTGEQAVMLRTVSRHTG